VRVERIGVVGAGTMGAGIAQIACLGGFETVLHDPLPEALATGEERVRAALRKGTARDLWSETDAEAAASRLRTAAALEDLGGCQLVIEAAPEELDLKRALFMRLAELCGPQAILATNTSSLSVTAMAAEVERPERVCGMHFFNPPALMRLVEIVAGEETSEETLATAAEVGTAMGREPIRARDAIGFVANRCVRPFTMEALRLFGDRLAELETIDRIVRVGGGFRMGPFELMDLVGVDVNLEVARSFWEQSFHEPRWRPHPIQARMVAAGRLGRKAGRGYYDYSGPDHRPPDPDPPRPHASQDAGDVDADLIDEPGFRAVRVERGSLAALAPGADAVGFVALPTLAEASLVELTRGASTRDATATVAERFFRGLGKHVEWVGDAPGLVLGRIVAQLVNEAHFTVQQGIATGADCDTAMRLGFNWPRGPFEWSAAIGATRVLTVLDALRSELGEERYRAAPALRRAAGREGGPPPPATIPPG
jgi:3-hydroxybutyryl-CoA dehydrogenase